MGKKFQFIPRKCKVIVTDDLCKLYVLIEEREGRSLAELFEDWAKNEANEGDYFNGETFEVICCSKCQ